MSKLNLCRAHMDENAKEVMRKAKRKHMRIVRETVEHKQPRTYVKPPQSKSMKRVSRAEKREIEVLPVLDTQAERARVAKLLEKARRERVVCNISRFSDDRECLMEWRG